MKLVQVQVFFRHGARTPLFHVKSTVVPEAMWTSDISTDLPHTVYPYRLVDISTQKQVQLTSDYLDRLYVLPGGNRVGELTKGGQEDAYNLGIRLRRQYMEEHTFLTQKFLPSQFYMRTTFISRTIKSLRCLIAGLAGSNFDSLIVLPTFECEKLNKEILFPNLNTCEIIPKLFKEGIAECSKSKAHEEVKATLRRILGVERLLDCVEQRSTSCDCPIYFVRDDYLARKQAGFPIPSELDKILPQLDNLAAQELLHELLGQRKDWEKNVHIVFGDLFSLILSNMINYEKLPQFHLYSCHDSSLMLLLFGLSVYDGSWPPFSADLIFELYTTESSTLQLSKTSPILRPGDASLASIDHISPENWNNLWFRLLYLGKPIPLKSLWNLSYPNDYNMMSDNSLVPLKALHEYLEKAKKAS
ncbi:unnamed protein product [Trichobilharzia szidati]|nr:unnamed protein product [Trichobilharzia szidati]